MSRLTVCTQVIFDSADLESAIDALIMNRTVCDNLDMQLSVNIVYVQENLKERFMQLISNDRLNKLVFESNRVDSKLEQVVDRFGCEARSNVKRTLSFVVDVQQSRLDEFYDQSEVRPVSVIFFRGASDVYAMLAADTNTLRPVGISIWTENISTLYSFAANVENDLIWCNMISFDKNNIVEQLSDEDGKCTIDESRGVITSHYFVKKKGASSQNTVGKMKHLFIAHT